MIQAATFGRTKDPQAQEADERFDGVNMRLAPDKLPPGLVCSAENFRMRDGELDPRKGVMKPAWLNVTSPGVSDVIGPVDAFYGSGLFKDPSSVEWTFLAADGFIFRCRPHNCRFSLPLPTGVKIISPCTFTQAFNKSYCFRGRHLATLVLSDIDLGFEDIVQQWDATATYDAAVLVTGQAAEEIAYGPFQAVTSLTSVADIATVVTTAEHGYVTGADITIKGANEVGYNGRWNITVVDNITFTYQFGGAASPATGTIKCSNMSDYWRAVGSSITLGVGELTSAATTATVTHAAHGFTTGQYVTIAGATQAEYNGTYLITVTDANHFTYVFVGSATTPATGTITATTSIVLAGQNPDTTPGAWDQIFNILPNADDALYINNRLLVPTAYTPGDTDYDSTSSYTKKDFVVATDIQDNVHFDFQNEFRINQGSDDEIMLGGLVKFGPDTAIVCKGKSWGVLSNIGIDLSNLTLDMKQDGYGSCAPVVVAGRDVLMPVLRRGIVSIQQNQLGQLRSVDVPFTNDLGGQPGALVNRINWNFADKIRLAYWDDKLYAAVPLDDATLRGQANVIPVGAEWGTTGVIGFIMNVTAGRKYYFTAGSHLGLLGSGPYPNGSLVNGTETLTDSGIFVAQGSTVTLFRNISGRIVPTDNYTKTGVTDVEVNEYLVDTNNAILVYDYRAGQTGQWQGADTGAAICPMEFFKANYNGEERLFYIAADGFANMVEEASAGDEILDTSTDTGLAHTPILTDARSRGYRFDAEAQKSFKQLQVLLGVWGANYSILSNSGAVGTEATHVEDEAFSRFTYYRPFDRTPYEEGNVNDDFADYGRRNYSVILPAAGGLLLGADGVNPNLFQELTRRVTVPTPGARYLQIRVTNSTGACKVKSITLLTSEGQRRGGII